MTQVAVSLMFFVLGLLFFGRNGKWWRVAAVLLVGGVIGWQNGMRDWQHMTNDTLAYRICYEEVKMMKWKDLLSGVKLETQEYSQRDRGFLLFVKATQAVSPRFRFLLLVVAGSIVLPLCWLIWRFSPTAFGIFLAGIVFEALFAGFFMTAMRQTLAMGIALCSLWPLMRRQYWLHYLILAPACLIHTIALVYLPLAPLLALRHPRRVLGWALCALPLLMFVSKPLLQWIGEGTMIEGYAVNSTDNLGTPVFSALLVCLAVLLVWKGPQFLAKYGADWSVGTDATSKGYGAGAIMMVCAALAIVAAPASWVDSNFIRVAFCYLIVLLPLASMLIEAYGHQQLLYCTVSIGLIVLKMR